VLPTGVSWGVCLRDAATGQVLAEHRPGAVLPTASVGKLLLLLEVAGGGHDLDTPVRRGSVAPVADSGLWQHLRADALSVHDAAVLVAAVSDNLATNVLLRHVGLDAVDRLGERLGLVHTRLHDVVRDVRGPQHPPTLSSGTAGELSRLAVHVHDVRQVREWLTAGADLSMVASAWGLDPLAHAGVDRGLRAWCKTGTDVGVRADVGVLAGPRRAVAYAVLTDGPDARRDDVLAAMAEVGRAVRALVG
jgi:beta-lactamase class A